MRIVDYTDAKDLAQRARPVPPPGALCGSAILKRRIQGFRENGRQHPPMDKIHPDLIEMVGYDGAWYATRSKSLARSHQPRF